MVRFFGVDLVDIGKQVLDCLHEGFVRRALGQDQRLDHGGVHRTSRVRFQDRKPVSRWQIVPWRRGVAMDCRHEPRCGFSCLGYGAGRVVHPTLILLPVAGGGALVNRNPQLLDKAGGKVSVLLPEPNQVVDLSDMLRTVVEGCGAPDQCGKRRLQLRGEGLVSAAVLDVVEDVVENVQDMKAPASRGRHTTLLQARGRGILLRGKRLGERDQILAERGGPGRRRNQIAERPLLASLGCRLADRSTQR